MTTPINRQWRLKSRPPGEPSPDNFELHEAPLPIPGDGEALVRSLYLSLDPYMRGRMRDAKSYVPPVPLGAVMTGGVVGEVVESRDPALKPGDIVEGLLGWQEYGTLPAKQLRPVDPSLAPISTALGILGMPGITAYFGLLEIGALKDGETVVVSAASGAVGGIVGQLAKIKGCRTVGTVGSAAKAAYVVDELGYDAAILYKTADDLDAEIAAACPDGVDVYFDNVGGVVSDAVLRRINVGARIPVCGQISQYNLEKPEMGPRLTGLLLVNRARMQGFIVFDFAKRYGEALEALAGWLSDGRLKYREDIIDGFENMPAALIRLLRGENFGKQLVRIAAS
ncbi:MAG: NADP-dependent oxidoreductase [Alphaproteobacteria bacterium]|nr:NADP-dependent oxidoreductase [Alphaproteobacteria bacterium]